MAGSNDFTGQKIQDSYQRVLQLSSSGDLADGTGSFVQSLNITASYAISSSHEVTFEVSASHADLSDTASYVLASNIAQPFINVTASGNISASGTGTFNRLDVEEYIYHKDDNTYIRFLPDRIVAVASNNTVLNLNVGGDLVEFGHTSKPSVVKGSTVTLTGNVTASGNISASSYVNLPMIIGQAALRLGSFTAGKAYYGHTNGWTAGNYTANVNSTTAPLVQGGQHAYIICPYAMKNIKMMGQVQVLHANTGTKFEVWKGTRQNGGGFAQPTKILSHEKTSTSTDNQTRFTSFDVTSTETCNAGDTFAFVVIPVGASNVMKCTYAIYGETI